MSDRVWYSSFNHLSIEKIHLLDPEAKVGFLYANAFTGMPAFAGKLGMDALHPAFFNLFSPRFMDDCREKGILVNIWTIDSEAQMLACMEAGVHAIITNYPDKAKKVAGYWTDGIREAIPLTVGKLLGKEEQTEDEKKPLSEMNDQMRQRLFELFRSKYEVQEAENKNAESDTGYIFTT